MGRGQGAVEAERCHGNHRQGQRQAARQGGQRGQRAQLQQVHEGLKGQPHDPAHNALRDEAGVGPQHHRHQVELHGGELQAETAVGVQLECYEVEVLGGELRTEMALSVQLECYVVPWW